MLRSAALLVVALGATSPLFAQSCPAGQTTSISGVVYAPNGFQPLPNVTVYVPTVTPLAPFDPGVGSGCPAVGAKLPGNPSVGGYTDVHGSFKIDNVPLNATQLVIVSGRWRRIVPIAPVACANTTLDPSATHFARTQSEGEIPKFAVVTGGADAVECVLRKVGVADTEFTGPDGTGRIQLYQGDGDKYADHGFSPSGGAVAPDTTPASSVLMSDESKLNQYDVLMLPCEGGETTRPPDQLGNLVSFANAGGRVYASHFAYSWMWMNGDFQSVASWVGGNSPAPGDGEATVVTTFAAGRTLSDWLTVVGATTIPGQIGLSEVKHDISGVASTTQPWLTLNSTGGVMQFVFDTPVRQTTTQCGRVLFNEYHVEGSTPAASKGAVFPAECSATASMTPQEKLLEYSLFELTDDGGQGELNPTSLSFGSIPVSFPSAPQNVTWTNHSTFALQPTVNVNGADYSIVNGCTSPVKNEDTCTISVTFTPQALGTRTGTLSVSVGSDNKTTSLTGVGVPVVSVSATSMTFSPVDVGASSQQMFVVTNTTSSSIPMPQLAVTGDFTANSPCVGGTLSAAASCPVTVTFRPTTYGSTTGTLTALNGGPGFSPINLNLSGTGWDFTVGMSPTSGQVIAGRSAATVMTLTPLAGFANPTTLLCNTNVPGSICSLSTGSVTPSGTSTVNVSITTTSAYTVIGYGGMGGGWLVLFGLCVAGLLWRIRRRTATLARIGPAALVLLGSGVFLTGCGNLKPAANSNPTTPGTYTYTVQATDGTITHSTSYSLTVTAK